MATKPLIPLSYDYQDCFAEDVRVALMLRAEWDATKTPLQLAGERLDTAASNFNLLCTEPGRLGEEHFAATERKYLEAKEAYRALIVKATGENERALERRLAA